MEQNVIETPYIGFAIFSMAKRPFTIYTYFAGAMSSDGFCRLQWMAVGLTYEKISLEPINIDLCGYGKQEDNVILKLAQ